MKSANHAHETCKSENSPAHLKTKTPKQNRIESAKMKRQGSVDGKAQIRMGQSQCQVNELKPQHHGAHCPQDAWMLPLLTMDEPGQKQPYDQAGTQGNPIPRFRWGNDDIQFTHTPKLSSKKGMDLKTWDDDVRECDACARSFCATPRPTH